VSSIKFDYRTQSNSIDAIGSILFGRKTKWYTKLIYTVQLNKVELGLFGGEVTSLGGELVGGETSWWRDDR